MMGKKRDLKTRQVVYQTRGLRKREKIKKARRGPREDTTRVGQRRQGAQQKWSRSWGIDNPPVGNEGRWREKRNKLALKKIYGSFLLKVGS